jgi:hypothetical protein
MDFEDTGKADYNIEDAANRRVRYGKVPEKLFYAVLDKRRSGTNDVIVS